MADRYYIMPGRFQPFHNDHLFVVRQVLSRISGSLFIGIIIHTFPSSNLISEFETEARLQNSPERNPFSPLARIKMITRCIHAELCDLSDRVFTILLPRPEANWSMIEAMFPGVRTWIVPDAGEDFDEMKAQFFTSQGDQVLRIPVEPSTSGYVLRKLIATGSENWRVYVPAIIGDQIDLILGEKTDDV